MGAASASVCFEKFVTAADHTLHQGLGDAACSSAGVLILVLLHAFAAAWVAGS
jgi:hypothetical protein